MALHIKSRRFCCSDLGPGSRKTTCLRGDTGTSAVLCQEPSNGKRSKSSPHATTVTTSKQEQREENMGCSRSLCRRLGLSLKDTKKACGQAGGGLGGIKHPLRSHQYPVFPSTQRGGDSRCAYTSLFSLRFRWERFC